MKEISSLHQESQACLCHYNAFSVYCNYTVKIRIFFKLCINVNLFDFIRYSTDIVFLW